jgi:hypothetical protein
MAIRKKSLRRMTELAKRCAKLHNEAASLARKLRNLAADIQDLEIGLRKNEPEWFEEEEESHGTKSRL